MLYPSSELFPSATLYPESPPSLTVPANARGPILDLGLPASTPAVTIRFVNETTGKSLALTLPAEWPGIDLSLDFRKLSITGPDGGDYSSVLDPEDNELWGTEPLAGDEENVIRIEVVKTGEEEAAGSFEATATLRWEKAYI